MANVVSLDAFRTATPPRRRLDSERSVGTEPTPGLAIVLYTRPDVVVFQAGEREIDFTPDRARELAHKLLDLADDAEAIP